MDADAVSRYLADAFTGVQLDAAEGVTFASYNPDRRVGAGVYFATIKTRDDANDDVSQLDRPGVFRLNFALPEASFVARFGSLPPAPGPDGEIETTHDFTALDVLMPHPVYAYLGWVCVLSPGDATFETVKPLLAEAHALAKSRYAAPPG